jgi:hypothetical protein
VLADLGGRVHPLGRKIIAPSVTRIRALFLILDAAILDEILGGWLRDPDHAELDESHGRIIRRSIWVADAGDTPSPGLTRTRLARLTWRSWSAASGASSRFTG